MGAALDLPDWITVQHGPAPILLIAPHGGRRHDPRHPGKHKVNDLHTADLTRELARRLGATAIINDRIDRNQLDLNRLSQVRAGAPWLMALLADVLSSMTAAAASATVLVIHGWNVTQAVCDVGVGLRDGPDGLAPVRPDTATVSTEFLTDRIRPLQLAADAADIAVTIGSRYPAAHANNLLQAFRTVADQVGMLGCPVEALCRRASIQAVQLELGIPLRWPGPRRERFIALLDAAFGVERERGTAGGLNAKPLALGGGRIARRTGLQFVAGELVVLTGIDASEHGPLAGRLLVSRGPERLALFTGELHDRSTPWTVPPLACRDLPGGGFGVSYAGPLLEFGSLTPFLDLERGLAGGALVEAVVDLTFRPHGDTTDEAAGDGFGTVSGTITIDGATTAIEAVALAARGAPHVPRSLPALRVVLPSTPWGRVVLSEDPTDAVTIRDATTLGGPLQVHGTPSSIRASCELTMERPTGRLVLELSEGDHRERLVTTLERMIPVRRPGRGDAVIETTYATLHADGGCVGWVELTAVETPDQPDAATPVAVSEA